MLGPRTEVRVQEDVDALVDVFLPEHLHVDRAADAALRAVGGDDVLRAHTRLGAGETIGQRDGHARRVLLEGRQLGVEAQLARRRRLGESAEDRLQIVLRAERVADRARGLVLGPRASGDAAVELFPGERARPHDEARAVGRQAGVADALLHAELAVHLHRARVDAARLGMHGGARVTLDQQRADAEVREQDRGGQPDRPAADDEDGDLEHGPSITRAGAPDFQGLGASDGSDAANFGHAGETGGWAEAAQRGR